MTNTNANLKLIETFYDEAKTKVNERYFVDKNGLKQGLYKAFHKSGKPLIRCTYKNGLRQGLAEMFHKNGKLEIRFPYKDGKLVRAIEQFVEDGKKIAEYAYKDGDVHIKIE